MATTGGSVPFAIDESAMSPVSDAVSNVGVVSPIEVVLLSALVAVLLVGFATVFSHLDDASDRIEREIADVIAERDAYRAFADAVDGIAASQPTRSMATPQTIQSAGTTGAPVDSVRRAFEQTVMAMHHYEETYDESWDTHLQSEFDDDVVAGLRKRGCVNEPIKRALRGHALDAARKRDDLAHVLKTERSAVDEARTTLAEVDATLGSIDDGSLRQRSFEDLSETYSTLDTLHSETLRVVERRQRQIHRETRCEVWASRELTLQEYLYDQLPVTYPVLDAAISLTDDLRTANRLVQRRLTETV
ncbi:DUF7260 family protein [Halanaeroarchaeum sulfurireducens]|nr:hypothetical protein [Halanaeroarchaeum sulfurireducens]